MSEPSISVILCTHNPRASSLVRVLQALSQQSLPLSDWELLLIDNASATPVRDRSEFSALWSTLPARFVNEPTLGLTPARLRGFVEAKAPVLVLIDDDTVPARDYLEQCKQAFADQPTLGAIGGRIHGEFERPPPRWAHEFLDCLAVRDYGEKPIRALIHNTLGPWEPCGAGMALRATVARAYTHAAQAPQRRQLDRVGAALTSCGDTDLARTAADIGLYLGYEPRLKLTHLIPAGRLRLSYLIKLVYAIQRDGWLLLRLRQPSDSPLRPTAHWIRIVHACLASASMRPQSWLLRLAARLGQLKGRSIPIDPKHV